MHGGQEETWRGSVRVECKSGGQVSPVITRWRAIQAQAEARRDPNDDRPLVGVLVPSGRYVGSEAVVLMSLDDWTALAAERTSPS